jgi:hypothetical protein
VVGSGQIHSGATAAPWLLQEWINQKDGMAMSAGAVTTILRRKEGHEETICIDRRRAAITEVFAPLLWVQESRSRG